MLELIEKRAYLIALTHIYIEILIQYILPHFDLAQQKTRDPFASNS